MTAPTRRPTAASIQRRVRAVAKVLEDEALALEVAAATATTPTRDGVPDYPALARANATRAHEAAMRRDIAARIRKAAS